MRKSKSLMIIIAIILMLSVLAGCSSETTTPSTTPDEKPNTEQNEETNNNVEGYEKPKFLTIGTGAAGGAFYPIGISVADIITNQSGIQTTAQVSGGAFENIALVQEGTVDMGITMGNAAQMAYEGTGKFESAHTNISALFGGLSRGYFQVVVAADSNIQSMADLKGKKVVMGPAGNGAISVAETIWNEYGFGVEDVNAAYVSYSDGVSSLTDGNCDAVVVQAAIPTAAIKELSATGKTFRLLSVDEEIAKKLEEKYAYFGTGEIGASIYGNEESATTMYITNMMIIRSDLDENLVYELTKLIFENLDTVKESHPAAKGLTQENAVRTPIPLHPGAEKYYKEIGAR